MNAGRIFAVAASIAVAVGLVLAFWFTGTPSHMRSMQLDRQRVDDLSEIASALHQRYGYSGAKLPAAIGTAIERYDPQTNKPYEFHRVNTTVYVLCAVFAVPSPADDLRGREYESQLGRIWRHGGGRTCYKLDVMRSDAEPLSSLLRQRPVSHVPPNAVDRNAVSAQPIGKRVDFVAVVE